MKDLENFLILIPARGGSKGIPGKNIKHLDGKPLLYYTINVALELTSKENICLSSDSQEIVNVAIKHGLAVPFLRPFDLATDSSGAHEVIIHAYNYFKSIGKDYEAIILLQPTSPFRTNKHIKDALDLYSSEIDMVVSVCESEANPYFNLFEVNEKGYLEKVKEGNYFRRQDCPKTYLYNGAIYIINVKSLLKSPLHQFQKVVKYEMDKISSTDLDSLLDWTWAEFLIEKKLI